MAEPTTTTAAGVGLAASLIVALFGPDGLQYVALAGSSFAGSLWPLSNRSPMSAGSALLMIARLSGTSLCLTGLAVWAVKAQLGWSTPTLVLTVALSFGIAALGDKWRDLIAALGDRLRVLVSGGGKT